MSVENKVFEKIRKVLIADATIISYVEDRVYASHISSIDRPIYPAISIHLIDSRALPNVPDMAHMIIQIDLWLSEKLHQTDDVLDCHNRIRELLHKQCLTDTTIGVKFYNIAEAAVGPLLYDEMSKCRHLPIRYSVVAI